MHMFFLNLSELICANESMSSTVKLSSFVEEYWMLKLSLMSVINYLTLDLISSSERIPFRNFDRVFTKSSSLKF